MDTSRKTVRSADTNVNSALSCAYEVTDVARALYTDNHYRDGHSEVRMYAVGDAIDASLGHRHPAIYQLTWTEILGFIHDRFLGYEAVKADHQQWGDVGRRLYDLAKTVRDRAMYVQQSRVMLRDGRGHGLESAVR